jgi:hypothetical protein
VRLSLLLTNLRQLTDAAGTVGELAAEDGSPVAPPIERGRFRITAAETLNSLRFFDKVVPAGVAAEPY